MRSLCIFSYVIIVETTIRFETYRTKGYYNGYSLRSKSSTYPCFLYLYSQIGTLLDSYILINNII